MRKSDLHYHLPPKLIAQEPLPDRSASRLLCLDGPTGRLVDRQFTALPELLAPGDLLILNDTRVIPARLRGRKTTGGQVEILIERVIEQARAVAFVRASKPPRPGGRMEIDGGYQCTLLGRQDDRFVLEFSAPLQAIMAEVGHIPLPPYIDRPDRAEDWERYQTVYARSPGAVAAPTAGLHFDAEIFARLAARDITWTSITLHVGSGTFQPLRAESLAEHHMHSETCVVSAAVVERIRTTKQRGGRIVAVGTTVVRSLETAARDGTLQPYAGETDLFIVPGFEFRCVDALVTNFHLPESTLLALVCAFAGHAEVMAAYRHAVDRKYRFFSYGDAMFLTRKRPPS